MQGIMRLTYLGIDEFKGKKDPTKTFYNVSILQGSEVSKVFLESGQEELFEGLEKYNEIECLMSWRLGQDKYGMKIEYKIITLKVMQPESPEVIEEGRQPDKVADIKGKKSA